MARVDVDQTTVMAALIARLKDRLQLAESHCYETINPPHAPPVAPPGGDFFVTVLVGDGAFDEGMQDAGGEEQLKEECEVTVTGYSRIRLDRVGHDTLLLHDDLRGLLKAIKFKILKALVGVDLQNEDDEYFLRDMIRVRRASQADHDKDKGIGWISIVFVVSWDWDLADE
jgi:hypothetical protein